MDDSINIGFGILMAVLGLITIYQAARLAALHTRRTSKWPSLICVSVQSLWANSYRASLHTRPQSYRRCRDVRDRRWQYTGCYG